jgi:ribosome biogenesis GTPase A
MNALVKKRVAAVGDEPAVTKQQQRIDLSPRQTLFDTPGLMWPKIEHDSDGYMLAASHAIGTNAVMEEEVATFLAGVLLDRYRDGIAKRYGFSVADLDAVGVLEGVAKKRGCMIKGRAGEFDMDKASLILLTDYRSGALGRISLETPETRAIMLDEAAAAAAAATPRSC